MSAEWPKAGDFRSRMAGLVAAPILIYFILHPEDFLFRSKEVSLSLDSQRTFGWRAFLNNVVDYLLIFGAVGDRNEEIQFRRKTSA